MQSPFYRNVWEVAVQINKVNKIYWYFNCFHQNARWVLSWQTKIISQQALIVTILFYNYADLYFLIIVLLLDHILVLILGIMVQMSFRRFWGVVFFSGFAQNMKWRLNLQRKYTIAMSQTMKMLLCVLAQEKYKRRQQQGELHLFAIKS